ncbi:uncharacterized protein LOC128857797 [Anastrepha ludens]|uniref:uncharacterized protein LOC128857797 n=1 Tax=Anastrepha ludens TaxID=28586 RepID=UPI0023AF5E8F|nr:uncharacterized protein LOC128857797 [Anastrepha ludens]
MERYPIAQRVKVIQAYYENGCSNQNAYRALRDFFGQFNRPNVRTIGKMMQKFEQTGSVGDVKTPVHARTARTAENIAGVRDSVVEEPSTSTRRRAQQLHLSRSSLMNIILKDLHLHAYKVQLTQELKPLDHFKRRQCSEWWQEMATVHDQFSKKIIFSGEVHFHLSGFVNKQNCRIWADDNPRVIAEKPMHSQRVTVWCGLWTGGIIGPYFFQNEAGQAVTVISVRYREMITNFLWPELEDMDVDDMWFQQDGATCHTANETMALLREKFDGRIISRCGDVNCPPRSCDLTPLDFFLWGYLKEKEYVDKPATIQELKNEIIRHVNGIEPQLCLSVIENCDLRMEVCRRSRGEHLPDILFHM